MLALAGTPRRRLSGRAACVVLGLTLLTACNAPATSAPAAPAPPPAPVAAAPAAAPPPAPVAVAPPAPTHVSVAYPTRAMTMTGFYIATEEGYTREEGLDAEMVLMVGTLSAQSMVARQIDFGMSAGALLAARLRGAPTRIIFVQIDRPLFYLYAQPEIGTLLDLVGKSVGVSSVGDSTQVAAMAGLAAGGVRPDQVTFIANVTGSQALAALQAGSVAAAVTSPPTDVATGRLGYRNLGFLGDHIAYLTAGLATHEEVLRDRPAVVRGMVRAELKAHRYMQQNRAGTIAHMARFQEIPLEEAAIVYDRNLQHFTTDGLSTPERLDEMLRTLRQELGVDEPVSPDDAFALSFARQAVEELDRAGWRP